MFDTVERTEDLMDAHHEESVSSRELALLSDLRKIRDAIPRDEKRGQRIGDFEIISQLGVGGMAVVYRAKRTGTDEEVALKLIQGWRAEDLTQKRRFEREIDIVARLDHQNVVRFVHAGMDDDAPYLVMELFEGGTLRHRIDRAYAAHEENKQPIDHEDSLRYMVALAGGVAYLHSEDLVHRDLKPSNALVDLNGRVAISDFGLARSLHEGGRLTVARDNVGTYKYMAPEQLRDARNITQAADVYSLGVVFVELLTGVRYRATPPPVSLWGALTHRRPPSPFDESQIPRDIQTICRRCLELDPEDRYQDAGALLDDLRRVSNGDSISNRAGRSLIQRVLSAGNLDLQLNVWAQLTFLLAIVVLGYNVAAIWVPPNSAWAFVWFCIGLLPAPFFFWLRGPLGRSPAELLLLDVLIFNWLGLGAVCLIYTLYNDFDVSLFSLYPFYFAVNGAFFCMLGRLLRELFFVGTAFFVFGVVGAYGVRFGWAVPGIAPFYGLACFAAGMWFCLRCWNRQQELVDRREDA